MILSQPDLRRAVEQGKIGFDPPLEDRQWGEASIDLRLGFPFTVLRGNKDITISVANGLDALASTGFWVSSTLAESNHFGKADVFSLGPGEFALAMTHESVRVPPDMIARVEGRSTYARVGLSMHQTAPWIQPGWEGPIILEIMNNGPLTINLQPLIDRPCQITFFRLTTAVPKDALYGTRATDRYQRQRHPIQHPRGSAPGKSAAASKPAPKRKARATVKRKAPRKSTR